MLPLLLRSVLPPLRRRSAFLHVSASARAPAGVCVVSDADAAARVVSVMRAQGAGCVHAWDTEVVDLDLEEQSPVGHGRVICASLYSGPSVDYGGGCSRVWVDATAAGGAALAALRGALEDAAGKKVGHNFSFDRAVLGNHGISATLAADTMHMARLWDTGRLTRGGYSLEGLTADLLDRRKVPMKELFARPRVKKVRARVCDSEW
jgi:DNA polymerase-1